MAPQKKDFVYVDQPLPLRWETTANMLDVTIVQVKYEKPSGATGFVTMSYSAAGTLNGLASQIYRGVLSSADVDETGEWQFRAWLTVSYDPNPIPGRIFRVVVHDLDEVQ